MLVYVLSVSQESLQEQAYMSHHLFLAIDDTVD